MPDEAIAAPSPESVVDSMIGSGEDTPTPNAPATDDGQGAAPEDAEQGYLRHSDYTRKTQELAQQRQEFEAQQEQATQLQELAQQAFLEGDEEAAQAFLEAIGYESDDDADYGESTDPKVAALEKQLAEVNEFVNQQKQEQEQRQQAAHIDSEFHRLTGESWDRANPDHESILARAAFLSPEDGQIDIEAGHKAFVEERDRIIEAYRTGKIPAANNSNLQGTPASAAVPDNATPEARALSIMEAHGI